MRKLLNSIRLLGHMDRLGYRLVWSLLVAMLFAGCVSVDKDVDVAAILGRIHPGDDREQALLTLSDSWYHTVCGLTDGAVEDVFLYGPKDRDKVTLILVRSLESESQLIVESAGSMESYFLNPPDAFTTCEPPILDAFEPPQDSK